jgi:hypothetical protein
MYLLEADPWWLTPEEKMLLQDLERRIAGLLRVTGGSEDDDVAG